MSPTRPIPPEPELWVCDECGHETDEPTICRHTGVYLCPMCNGHESMQKVEE